MVLYTCNNSSTIDIEGAEKYFTNLPLNNFPDEKISDIATTDIRHIKVMRGTYALHPKLGTTLLLKVCKTSIEIFNQNILNYYSDTNELETKYYPKDPCMMENDNGNSKYGPVGVCGYLQDEYGFFQEWTLSCPS